MDAKLVRLIAVVIYAAIVLVAGVSAFGPTV